MKRIMVMLQEFVTLNRDELVKRCRSKVSQRASPPERPCS